MSTEVIVVQPAPRKRRRRIITLVVIVVVVAVLIVGYFVAESFARSYADNYVREKVAAAVGLKSTAPVHVNLGSGSLIFQAISGSIDSAKVSVDPLTVQGFTGSATVTATGVPLDAEKPVKTMDVALTVPASTIQTLLKKSLPELGQLGATFAVSGGHIVVGMKISVFGLTIPVGASVTPGVRNGAPTFTLSSVTISGQKASASAFEKLFPGVLGGLTSGQSICVANFLPKEFALSGVSVHGTSLTYEFSGDGAKLTAAALGTRGACPAG
jgi:LmeA-like phospholipid-binding